MYKRLELHNHTQESDGHLTAETLINFMFENKVDAFALTDHNTISGHSKVAKYLDEHQIIMPCIYGMEYTTYYGHILCFNLKEYVPWENINLHHPELLFTALKEKGALTGIAHPFSSGYPIGTCRFTMTFKDYACVDFIEIFNNPEPLREVNERGLLWWESLILEDHRIAFTSGMDLHGTDSMLGQFATFIKGIPNGNIESELHQAITTQQTWISKGPLLHIDINKDKEELLFSISPTAKSGYIEPSNQPYKLTLRTKKETLSFTLSNKVPFTVSYSNLDKASPIIPKLYQGTTAIQDLLCVAPVIYL